MNWLVGKWSQKTETSTFELDLVLTSSRDGAHGALIEVEHSGRRRTLAEYSISQASSSPKLVLIEAGRTYRFIKASADAQHLRFDRNSYKSGTIIVEFSMFRQALLLRYAYGPQHGATPSTEYRLTRSAAAGD